MQDTEGHMAGPVSQSIKNYTGQTSILKKYGADDMFTKWEWIKAQNPEQSKKP